MRFRQETDERLIELGILSKEVIEAHEDPSVVWVRQSLNAVLTRLQEDPRLAAIFRVPDFRFDEVSVSKARFDVNRWSFSFHTNYPHAIYLDHWLSSFFGKVEDIGTSADEDAYDGQQWPKVGMHEYTGTIVMNMLPPLLLKKKRYPAAGYPAFIFESEPDIEAKGNVNHIPESDPCAWFFWLAVEEGIDELGIQWYGDIGGDVGMRWEGDIWYFGRIFYDMVENEWKYKDNFCEICRHSEAGLRLYHYYDVHELHESIEGAVHRFAHLFPRTMIVAECDTRSDAQSAAKKFRIRKDAYRIIRPEGFKKWQVHWIPYMHGAIGSIFI